MKIISRKTIDFPKFKFGLKAGEKKELPDNKEAQKAILANRYITKVGESSRSGAEENSANKNK